MACVLYQVFGVFKNDVNSLKKSIETGTTQIKSLHGEIQVLEAANTDLRKANAYMADYTINLKYWSDERRERVKLYLPGMMKV